MAPLRGTAYAACNHFSDAGNVAPSIKYEKQIVLVTARHAVAGARHDFVIASAIAADAGSYLHFVSAAGPNAREIVVIAQPEVAGARLDMAGAQPSMADARPAVAIVSAAVPDAQNKKPLHKKNKS